MFGRKKEVKKSNIKTYVDGVEQDSDEVQVPVPKPAESPVLEPQAVQEPTTQQEEQQVVEFNGECIICLDYGWYRDFAGVVHNCPRCNPKSLKIVGEISKQSSTSEDKPKKGNLYEFRTCQTCGERNEIHKKKIKWKCEYCGAQQEGM